MTGHLVHNHTQAEECKRGCPYWVPTPSQKLDELEAEVQALRKQLQAPPRLTPAEKKVLPLINARRNSQQIANILNIKPNTAKVHIRNIGMKLGARGAAEIRAKTGNMDVQTCPHCGGLL